MQRHTREVVEELCLVEREFPGRPIHDAAVSHALLRRVAARELPPTLRLYRPDDIVVFSLLDSRRPGFPRAVALARSLGFSAVLRLGGGHAAVFHRELLAFSWARRAEDSRCGIKARFEAMAQLTKRALVRLGVDARVGEVPNEYCPGEHSVNARGCTKLMGIGQRVIRHGAHLGGFIAVAGSERIREVLEPVYQALELQWDPSTAGAIADEVGSVTFDSVREALLAEIAAQHVLVRSDLDAETLALASELEGWHEPEAKERSPMRVTGKKVIAAG